MNKLCPKIILEGTRLTHKTDIALALNEHPCIVGPRRYRYHSPVISGEWCAFTNVPWGRGLINFKPDEEALALETYGVWMRLFELQRYYSWIIDRFHISTRLYQLQTHNKDYDFSWLEERLNAVGFQLIFCTRHPDSFSDARGERLRVSGNPRQYDDLSIFAQQQEKMRLMIAESSLQMLEIDVTDGDISRCCDQIADWMEQRGVLHAWY